MTVLHMDPTKLESVIQNIRALADECDAAKSRIYSEFEAEHDPTPIDDFPPAADKAIGNLNGRADTLEEAKNAIVAVNESGVGSMNAEGVISCDIPDSVSINNVEQLVSWSEAAIDAHDLQNIVETGRKSNGRDYDQVIESMREHADDSVYAETYIDCVGPENLTQLPLNVEGRVCTHFDGGIDSGDVCVTLLDQKAAGELAELQGTLLASASKRWDDDKCRSVAKAISGSVDDKEGWGQATVLNAMLDGHDENGDHVNDLDFNDAFLASLANRLDDINWDWDVPPGGRYLAGQSIDPMAGVLDAMGNNPEAALDYLAPASTGGDFDTTRLEELSKREWDEQGFAGFTAAAAAASSLRSSNAPDVRDRANALTDNSIHLLAVNTDESIYDDDAKARIGLLLANCPGELTNAWTGADVLEDTMHTEMRFSAASVEDANILTYRVADSVDAVSTIYVQLLGYAHTSGVSTARKNHDGAPAQQIEDINAAYNNASEATGALVGIADRKADNMNADADADAGFQNLLLDLTYAVFVGAITAAAAPLGPVAAGAAAGSTAGVGTLRKPVVADHVESAAPATAESDELLWTAAVQDASELGILDQDLYTYNGSNDDYDWIVHDPEGNYSIMWDAASSDTDIVGQLTRWRNEVGTGLGDHTISKLKSDFDRYFNEGKAYVDDRPEIPGYVEPADRTDDK
ncbi:DUF6571 family protein [Actinomyces procaprae]|uniref:DUF6571 family protein n=1 Tax=Actinomyces procaprae TaxID=2560010 RepID=UPI0010A22360|nr:DUF6571 family protein [Actinomyces procaprae]